MEVKEARRRRSVLDAEPAGRGGGRRRRAAGVRARGERRKPGNITPRHDFADTAYEDMLRSAIALGPELGRAAERASARPCSPPWEATRRVAGEHEPGIALLLARSRARRCSAAAARRAARRARRADPRRRARRLRGDPLWPARAASTSPSSTTCATRRDRPARGDGGRRRARLGRRRVRDRLRGDLRLGLPALRGRSTPGSRRAPATASVPGRCSRRCRTR